MDGEPARVLPHAQGSQVTPGITTWDELGPIVGNVLAREFCRGQRGGSGGVGCARTGRCALGALRHRRPEPAQETERNQQLAAAESAHAARVQQLTEAHAERVEAVLVRDRIIEDLRRRRRFTRVRERFARWLKSS